METKNRSQDIIASELDTDILIDELERRDFIVHEKYDRCDSIGDYDDWELCREIEDRGYRVLDKEDDTEIEQVTYELYLDVIEFGPAHRRSIDRLNTLFETLINKRI